MDNSNTTLRSASIAPPYTLYICYTVITVIRGHFGSMGGCDTRPLDFVTSCLNALQICDTVTYPSCHKVSPVYSTDCGKFRGWVAFNYIMSIYKNVLKMVDPEIIRGYTQRQYGVVRSYSTSLKKGRLKHATSRHRT
jgi:hypothetical protein